MTYKQPRTKVNFMRTKAAVDVPQIDEIDRKILLALFKDVRLRPLRMQSL